MLTDLVQNPQGGVLIEIGLKAEECLLVWVGLVGPYGSCCAVSLSEACKALVLQLKSCLISSYVQI